MVHVADDGEALVIVELKAEDIQEICRALAMTMITNIIVV
jgi:hypothetical protein